MLPEHIVAFPPEFTVAAWFIVSVIEDATEAQGPAGSSVVIVKVTVPLETSVAPGVYTAVLTKALLLKLPSPEVVQVEDVAPPPRVALDKVYVLPEHITSFAPALTVAVWLMIRVMDEMAAGQGPAGSSVVIVSVTVPLLISVGPGVYTAVFTRELSLKLPSPPVVQVDEVALPPRVAPDKV